MKIDRRSLLLSLLVLVVSQGRTSHAADIAIKAVTQNNFLVPDDGPAPAPGVLPEVLAQTSGVVLIDELDVHLHPSWQRTIGGSAGKRSTTRLIAGWRYRKETPSLPCPRSSES